MSNHLYQMKGNLNKGGGGGGKGVVSPQVQLCLHFDHAASGLVYSK